MVGDEQKVAEETKGEAICCGGSVQQACGTHVGVQVLLHCEPGVASLRS